MSRERREGQEAGRRRAVGLRKQKMKGRVKTKKEERNNKGKTGLERRWRVGKKGGKEKGRGRLGGY